MVAPGYAQGPARDPEDHKAAIARLPGCAGHAVSAYTQVKMEDTAGLSKLPKAVCQDFWIRLHLHKWPKSWSNVEDPWFSPERNLYGHPHAGQDNFKEFSFGLGRVKVPNWECLFVHRKQGLFPSVHVDDVTKAARGQNLRLMWKKLMKLVDVGEPTSFLDTTCTSDAL